MQPLKQMGIVSHICRIKSIIDHTLGPPFHKYPIWAGKPHPLQMDVHPSAVPFRHKLPSGSQTDVSITMLPMAPSRETANNRSGHNTRLILD